MEKVNIPEMLENEFQLQEEKYKAISNKTHDELVEFCKRELEKEPENWIPRFYNKVMKDYLYWSIMEDAKSKAYKEYYGSNNGSHSSIKEFNREHSEACLNTASSNGYYYNGLKLAVRLYRGKRISIPYEILEYIVDVELKIKKKPRKMIKKTRVKDAMILQLIQKIVKYTNYRPQRSRESDKECGISIVAKATNRSYSHIETLWKRRPRSINDA